MKKILYWAWVAFIVTPFCVVPICFILLYANVTGHIGAILEASADVAESKAWRYWRNVWIPRIDRKRLAAYPRKKSGQ